MRQVNSTAKKRVFIAGRSLFSAAGRGISPHWGSFCEGVSSLSLHRDEFPLGVIPQSIYNSLRALRQDRYLSLADDNTLLGMLCAKDALNENHSLSGSHTAVVVGTSRGPQDTLEKEILDLKQNHAITQKWRSPQSIMGVTSTAISNALGFTGPSLTVSTSCTSGSHALGTAFSLMQSGIADSAVAGGVEMITELGIAQFLALGAYGREGRLPYPLRPGHADRCGTVFGSGAAFLFLTFEKTPFSYAEVLSFAAASEKASPTGLSSNALSLQSAIRSCLERVDVGINEIDLIIGHGSGTVDGENAERAAYSEVFGEKMPLLSFNKWLSGHLIAASGPLSVVLATEHMRTGWVPAHPYLSKDEKMGNSHRKNLTHVLVTTLGFGGNATALLLKKAASE